MICVNKLLDASCARENCGYDDRLVIPSVVENKAGWACNVYKTLVVTNKFYPVAFAVSDISPR